VLIDPLVGGKQGLAINTLASQPVNILHLNIKKPFWEEDGRNPNIFSNGLAGMVIPERKGKTPQEITSLTIWIRGRMPRDGYPGRENCCRGDNGRFLQGARQPGKVKWRLPPWYRPLLRGRLGCGAPGQVRHLPVRSAMRMAVFISAANTRQCRIAAWKAMELANAQLRGTGTELNALSGAPSANQILHDDTYPPVPGTAPGG
jgi:hypothetical protein